jgi:biotin synthase
MAIQLRSLKADMIPVNFLHPIQGTPMANQPKLTALEILQIIAIYRFIMPNQHIKAAGGRVLNLGDMQSWIFYAGATAILTGNYLTTAGRSIQEDVDMIENLGLKPELV